MKLPRQQPPEAGLAGTVRADRRLATALRRAERGDIVVTDALDLDRTRAEALLRHGVAAVVSTSSLISGRYPNLGPELLAQQGVLLLDRVGPDVLSQVKDGARGRVEDGRLVIGQRVVAEGERLDLGAVRRRMDEARHGLASQLRSLTHNTTEYLRHEQDLLLHGTGLPELRTTMVGRPVLVVVRDFDHEADLRRLRTFIREQRPVLIGVDGGADALLAVRLRPDVVVVGARGLADSGERERVSDRALRAASEVVAHADDAERLPGVDRLQRLGIGAHRVASAATTEDVALLLADHAGAALLVPVGTHATLDEFLDRQREGLASTFVTRLRVGPRLVDARSIPVLYAGRVRLWHLALMLLAGLLAVAAAVSLTPRGEQWWEELHSALTSSILLVDTSRGPRP